MPDHELLELTAETLARLDKGKYAATLEAALKRAVQDCIDRPTDDRNRKVVVQFDLAPITDIDEQIVTCEGVKAKYQVKVTNPNWESKTLDFGVRRNGTLVFNADVPDNHLQMTFSDREDEVHPVD